MRTSSWVALGLLWTSSGLGALAYASTNGQILYEDSKLFRNTRQAVDESQIPPLPTAACVGARVEAEIVRTIEFMPYGWASINAHLGDFGFGSFLDNGGPYEELVLALAGGLDLQTGHFPPGVPVTFTFIYTVDMENVRGDQAVIDLLTNGSRVQYALGGGGGSIGGSGSWAMRISAAISARFDTVVLDGTFDG